MRMPTQKNPREARALYRERVSESRAAINALAKRWQMPAAEKGTQWPSKLITDEFNYSTPITTLPANGSAVVYITIDTDADFEIAKLMWFGNSASWVQGNAPVMVEMFDASSGRELITPTISTLFAGNGRIAARLPQVKNLSAKQMVGFRFQNLTAEAVSCQLTMGGRKIFLKGY